MCPNSARPVSHRYVARKDQFVDFDGGKAISIYRVATRTIFTINTTSLQKTKAFAMILIDVE